MYPSKTVLVPAHCVTIDYTDFGHHRNFKDYLDHPDLRCCIMLDESRGQYGLLIIPAQDDAVKEVGVETLRFDTGSITSPVYGLMHWTEIPPIYSWNLNYYRQRDETIVDTAERLLNVFNKRWHLHLTLYND